MEVISLIIVDDHKMVREGLRSILEEDHQFNIIAELAGAAEALKLLEKTEVDVILTDISMPGMDGIEFTRTVMKANPEQKVIALTMMGEAQHIRHMLKAGAMGYLLKNCGSRELKKAIHEVYSGNNYYSGEVKEIVMGQLSGKRITSQNNMIPLTERELEVLHLILKEYSNQEIADMLYISQRTVDAHKRNLLEKTGAKNIAGLVLYAIEKRLFDDI